MGNGEFQVSKSIKQEWAEQSVGSSRTFSNRITSQSFQLIVLTEGRSQLHIHELIQRSIYPLSKTPKIIILNDRQDRISLLVQRKVISLQALLSGVCLELQFLKIIHQIVATASALYRRYGPFGITEKMMGGSSWQEIILWVNEAYESCSIQLPPPKNGPPEQAMLQQLLEVIQGSASLYPRHEILSKPASTFSTFLAALSRAIQQERSGLSMQKVFLNNKDIDPPYPLSPRAAPSGSEVLKLPDNQIKRKNNIPNFIKTIQSKKQNPERQHKNRSNYCEKSDLQPQCQKSHGRYKHLKKQFTSNDTKNSIGKVRSLNASPSTKLHPRTNNGNLSNATTNNSVISWNVSSQGISDLLSASKKSVGTPKGHPFKGHDTFSRREVKLFADDRKEESKASSGINFRSSKCVKEENLGQVTFQKESETSYSAYSRSRFSFGSLNSFCKHLSESEELTEHRKEAKLDGFLSGNESMWRVGGEGAYSVVIHDEEHNLVSEKVTITEEFSRILY